MICRCAGCGLDVIFGACNAKGPICPRCVRANEERERGKTPFTLSDGRRWDAYTREWRR
jgi:hypothetical protein